LFISNIVPCSIFSGRPVRFSRFKVMLENLTILCSFLNSVSYLSLKLLPILVSVFEGGEMQFRILVSSCFKWMHKIVSNLSNVSFDILKTLTCFASSSRSFSNSVLNAPNLNWSTVPAGIRVVDKGPKCVTYIQKCFTLAGAAVI
jgi:hypothetical protein